MISSQPKTLTEFTINTSDTQIIEVIPPMSLLEERLVVHRNKRKLGEVTIRKEVKIKIIEVPIRRDKLIVEHIVPKYKKIASIDLGDDDLGNDIDSLKEISEEVNSQYNQHIVEGEFTSIKLASKFLEAIAHLPNSEYKNIKIRIEVQNTLIQKTYQELLENFSNA